MKLSNEKILTDINKLRAISEKQLPVRASYAIAKNIAKIESELKVYEKERLKLISEYAEKDKEGNVISDKEGQIIFKEDCKDDWDKDIKELLSIENEIDIHKFKVGDLNGYVISPAELMLIEYMIEE